MAASEANYPMSDSDEPNDVLAPLDPCTCTNTIDPYTGADRGCPRGREDECFAMWLDRGPRIDEEN